MDNSLSTGLTKVTFQKDCETAWSHLLCILVLPLQKLNLGSRVRSLLVSAAAAMASIMHLVTRLPESFVLQKNMRLIPMPLPPLYRTFCLITSQDFLQIGDSMPVVSADFSMKTPPSRLMCTWQFFLLMVDCSRPDTIKMNRESQLQSERPP